MPISTKLFNEQTIRSFGVMTDRTAELQKQVSTGKKDMRPNALLKYTFSFLFPCKRGKIYGGLRNTQRS